MIQANSTIEEMQQLAQRRGGKCLSDDYIDAHTQLCWQCIVGHIWEAEPRDVKFRAKWCPACALRRRRQTTLEDMKAFARQLGGKCLSAEYTNDQTKLSWQCDEGHIWQATSKEIRHYRGKWCPVCNTNSLQGQLTREHAETPTRRQNARTDKKIIPRYQDVLEGMQELAKQGGGKCLSNEHVGYNMQLKWQCGQGHVWEATSFYVKNTLENKQIGCPVCAKTTYNKLALNQLKKLASEKHGECISDEYINARRKLKLLLELLTHKFRQLITL